MSTTDPFTDTVLVPAHAAAPDARTSLLPYLGDLRRRWPLVIVGAIVGVIAAAGYLGAGQAVTATTDVDVSSAPVLTAATGGNAGFDAGTDIGIATSYPVAAAAALALGGGVDPAELRRDTTATAVDGTPIVHISYSDASPEVARERADAIAGAYLTFRDDAVAAALRTADTSTATSSPHGRVLTSAADNPVTTPTTPLAILASGGVAGAVLGGSAALIIAARRRARESRSEVVRRVGAVLADAEQEAEAGDGEAVARLARERILLRATTPLESIAIVDLASAGSGLLVPHELAVAFREIDWDCVVERGTQTAPVDDALEFAPLRIRTVGPHAGLAESLRVARGTDGVVIVHESGRAAIDAAAALSTELRAASAVVLGSILVAQPGARSVRTKETA